MFRIASVLLIAACSSGCAVQSPVKDRELSELLELLPGVYAGVATVPGTTDGRTQPIFHKIAPIDASQFGARSFYYQLSTGGPDGTPLQQKIFAFDTRPVRAGNRMRAWIFAPGDEPPNLEQSPDRWFELEPSRLQSFPDACAFRWARIGDGFEGIVSRQDCRFDSRRFGQPVSPDMRYAVFPDRLEWQESLYGADGELLVSTGGKLVANRD
jgi:hypothetical protein